MKNVISYMLGLLVLGSVAQAAPHTPAQTASMVSERKAVSLARVKLMNDARKLGPDSPQVQADKAALINALERLHGDSSGATRPVNVKRNPKKTAAHKTRKPKRTMAAKNRINRSKRKPATRKVSHLRARKHARPV